VTFSIPSCRMGRVPMTRKGFCEEEPLVESAMINLVFIKFITTGLAPSRAALAREIAGLPNSLHQLFWGRVTVGVQKRF
jgi:hypothetical protein